MQNVVQKSVFGKQSISYMAAPGCKPPFFESFDLIKMVCHDKLFITPEELQAKTRKKDICRPRQIIVKIIFDHYNHLSLTKIGNLVGLDHATVLHSVKVINNALHERFGDKETASLYRKIFEVVKNKLIDNNTFYPQLTK